MKALVKFEIVLVAVSFGLIFLAGVGREVAVRQVVNLGQRTSAAQKLRSQVGV